MDVTSRITGRRARETTVEDFMNLAWDVSGVACLEVAGVPIIGIEYDPTRCKVILFPKEPLRIVIGGKKPIRR